MLKDKIKLLRKNQKMNQTEFSKIIGITQSTLSSYEKGTATPSLDVLIAISSNFHVSVDWLLGLSASTQRVASISDIADFLFQLNDKNEVRYELEINNTNADDQSNSWNCAIRFYGNDTEHTANADICNLLGSLSEYRENFESFFIDMEMFNLWKAQRLEYYKDSALTNKEYEILDTSTRLKLRNEKLKEQFDTQK